MVLRLHFHNRQRLLFFISFLLVNSVIIAQDTAMVLQLNDAIKLAQASNQQVQIAQTEERLSEARYKETEAIYLPQVNLSYGGLVSNNPLNAFGFKLQQKSITQADFNPELLNDPSGTSDFMTKLLVQQPIFNPDLRYMRKSAEKQTEMGQYKTLRTQEHIAFQTEQAYLQLQMVYASKKVIEKNLENFKALYKFTNDRFESGLLQKSDLLNVAVQVKGMETHLAQVNSNIRNACDQLSTLMNKPLGELYIVPALQEEKSIPILADSIPASRSDFKAMEIALESYDLMIKSTKNAWLPKVNGFGSYQINDKDPLGFGAGSYLAGVMVSWDIFKGNQNKNKAATQTIERRQIEEKLALQKQNDYAELQKASRQWNDTKYKIEQQQTATGQAEEALRILNDRYAQGLVNTTDVLLAQSQLAQQQLLMQQAYMEQGMASAYLKFLLATP